MTFPVVTFLAELHAYTPFVDPLPIWSPPWLWSLLLIPLCLAVAIVYKAIKTKSPAAIPRDAVQLFVTIIVGMVAAALALAGIIKLIG